MSEKSWSISSRYPFAIDRARYRPVCSNGNIYVMGRCSRNASYHCTKVIHTESHERINPTREQLHSSTTSSVSLGRVICIEHLMKRRNNPNWGVQQTDHGLFHDRKNIYLSLFLFFSYVHWEEIAIGLMRLCSNEVFVGSNERLVDWTNCIVAVIGYQSIQ